HGFELSCATSGRASRRVIDHSGSSCCSSEPRVALITPPPIRTTSTGSDTPSILRRRSGYTRARGPELRRRGTSDAGEQLRGRELGELHGVEGGALAQVVVRDEQRQALAVGDRLILTDAAHEARILTGRLERVRHLRELHPGRLGEQLARALGRDRV